MTSLNYWERSRKWQASTRSSGKIEKMAIGMVGCLRRLRSSRCSFHRQCVLRAQKQVGNAWNEAKTALSKSIDKTHPRPEVFLSM